MITFTLEEIAKYINAKVVSSLSINTIDVSGVETDSRKDVKNKLFIALKGENFDAHSFIEDVATKGAIAVIVDHHCNIDIPQLIVNDTLIALGLIGQLNRIKSKAKVVSVTGTCGKTSVKEMCLSILSTMGNTIATKGNLNNAIGVPLSLLQIDNTTDYAVIELGANHPKELEYSVNLARPLSVVINNVGGAHLEGFGGINGVYKAKSEVFDYVLPNGGNAIVNGDNQFYNNWLEDYSNYKENIRVFSVTNTNADFYATDIKALQNGCFSFVINDSKNSSKQEIKLNLPGKHNISNALAAATLTSTLGANLDNICEGLSLIKPTKGRLYIEQYGNITLIDDAYNASVNAVKASIDTLSLLDGYKVFVFGNMGELGEDAPKLHSEIGSYASEKVDCLLTIGNLAKNSSESFNDASHAFHFDSKTDIYVKIKDIMQHHEKCVFVAKGAHSMHMDEVVNFIRQEVKK